MTTAATIEQHGTCACGAAVSRSRPADMSPGFASLWERAGFTCPACEARAEAKDAAERLEDERRRVADRRERNRRQAGLPEALQGLALTDLERTDRRAAALDMAAQWARGDIAGVTLTGTVGVGKTRIAAAATWERAARTPVRWMSTPLLFARLGSGFDNPQRAAALDILTGRVGLVLDDLDKARPTEYGAEQIFLAVDTRIDRDLPLLVTTNLSLGELAKKFPDPYGEAIASRLAGYTQIVRVAGDDRRTAA